jgi:hypothetical protein
VTKQQASVRRQIEYSLEICPSRLSSVLVQQSRVTSGECHQRQPIHEADLALMALYREYAQGIRALYAEFFKQSVVSTTAEYTDRYPSTKGKTAKTLQLQ